MRKTTSVLVLLSFILSCLMPPQGLAQTLSGLGFMPQPGTMVQPSAAFVPAVLKGMKIYPSDPLRFDFLIDTGNSSFKDASLQQESTKLIRYFLASLTVPDEDLWVNLSPYEGDRIIPDNFGLTEMGRDLLAEDYILKQLTSSLMYPEKSLGSQVWKKIYTRALEKFGTTDIPLDTFNKVWIVPDEAVVYVNGDNAFIAKSHLKVMLDTDYLAMKKNSDNSVTQDGNAEARSISEQVIREVVLPEIEQEVNSGENFSALRQIYHAMILSTWFKRNLKRSLVGQVYSDKNKVTGIDLADKEVKDKIWKQYVQAFKVGVFNYIKEEVDEATQEVLPRKYFSGGYHHDPAKVRAESVSESRIAEAAQSGQVGTMVVAAANLKSVTKGKQGSSGDAAGYFIPELREFKATIPFNRADFSMGSAFGNLLGGFFKGAKSSDDASGFEGDRLNEILAENGKYYEIRWSNEGARLLRDVFERHMRGKQADVLSGRFGDFPSLSGLWSELKVVSPADAFSFISQWIVTRFKELSGDASREQELAQFTIDATRFVQVVFTGEVRGAQFVTYNMERRSMINLLNNEGWNCQAISDLTAVLMGVWGARGVSVVSVVERPDGKRYPQADGTGHAANLVRVGKTVAYLDQGTGPAKDKGRVKVIRNGKIEEAAVASISALPGAEGLTIDRVFALLKAQNDLNVIRAKLGSVPGVTVNKDQLDINLTSANAAGMIKPFTDGKSALEKLAGRLVHEQHDRIPVTALEPTFKSNLEGALKVFNEMLQKAQEFSRIYQDGQAGDKTFVDFMMKCESLGLLTRNEKGGGYKVNGGNPAGFIKHAPGLLNELEGYLQTVSNPGFQTNGKMLKQLLSAELIFSNLLAKYQERGLITQQGDSYGYQISPETAGDFIREIPLINKDLDEILKSPQQEPNLLKNAKALKNLLDQALQQAAEMIKTQQVIDRVNGFVAEYNANQRNPIAMEALRTNITTLVTAQKSVIRSISGAGDILVKVYKAAGGVGNLDMAQGANDRSKNVGGIDLNSGHLRLQEIGGKVSFNSEIDVAMLGLQIDGFSPVILSLTPLSNSPAFFGSMKN